MLPVTRSGPPTNLGASNPNKRQRRLPPPKNRSEQFDPTPACPGVVKDRPATKLEKLPSDAEVFLAFTKIRKKNSLSDEEALLELISSYDLSLSSLSKISVEKLEVSFSNVTYEQVAPYVWLHPSTSGNDMQPLTLFRSRIPNYLFKEILGDLKMGQAQYGPMIDHDNEARSRYLSFLFNRIIGLFGGAITHKPVGLLDSKFSKRGRIEHHFLSVGSISVVFIEVKKALCTGKAGLDVIGQVLAESAACDFANKKKGHWTPILALLCDGANFDFFVLNSADKVVFHSGWKGGLFIGAEDPRKFLIAVKKTTERLFDWFIMAYINGIRSLAHRLKFKTKTRESTDQWETALSTAEEALCLLRLADGHAEESNWPEAETTAEDGVEMLKKSVAELPLPHVREKLTDECNWPLCMEQSLSKDFGSAAFR